LSIARLGLLAAAALACASVRAAGFDPSPWQQDFAQMRLELARSYANLDWAVSARRMDLKGLAAEASAQLAATKSEEEARRVFERFLAAFGDGHLRIAWKRPEAAPAAGRPAASTGKAAATSCADLGYRRPRDEGLDFAALPGFERLSTDESVSFPAGVLTAETGAKLGILRISLLMETAFPEACEQIHRAGTPCAGDCADKLMAAVGKRISASLERQVRALAARKVDALVVDLTGNGGGSDWAEAAARIVTAPGLAAPRVAGIRHPHWVKQLGERIADFDADLKRDDLPAPVRAALAAGRSRLAMARDAAAEPCDRRAIWEGASVCPLVTDAAMHSTGVTAVRPPFDLAGLEAAGSLYSLHGYAFTEGAWRGPLAALVDGGTASAAELFAATLADNDRATIIGSTTFGAGCGYTNGGIAIRLARSGATLRVPDCVRLRADGSNEVDGIAPDIAVPWRAGHSRYQRTVRALQALRAWSTVLPSRH